MGRSPGPYQSIIDNPKQLAPELYQHLQPLIERGQPLLPAVKAMRRAAVLPRLAGFLRPLAKLAFARPTKGMGIPDRSDFGDPAAAVEPGDVLDYFIQHHDARRAGAHYDLRAGTPETNLFSWATKKELPQPGGRPIALYQQPIHAYDYGSFSGQLGHGYGAGQVELRKKGKLLITDTTPTTVHFSTAGPGAEVKRYVLVNPKNPNNKSWLLIRGHDPQRPALDKEHYKSIPPEAAEDLLQNLHDNASVSAKVDGAMAFIRIAKHRAELMSHRISKRTGGAIPYTEKFFGKVPKFDYPEKFENSLLLSEIFGQRGDKAVPVQELGGILNAGVARSLAKQKEQGVDLKSMLFGIREMGGKPSKLPHPEQRKLMEELLPYLPKGKFLLPEDARTPEDALALFESVKNKEHPLSHEGVVIQPDEGAAMKSKFRPEQDVYLRGITPGQGKYQGAGAGAVQYSNEPEGDILGQVGTGLSDEMRRELWSNPELYLGRRARVTSHGAFPSGALRVPVFLGMHEDYPSPKER